MSRKRSLLGLLLVLTTISPALADVVLKYQESRHYQPPVGKGEVLRAESTLTLTERGGLFDHEARLGDRDVGFHCSYRADEQKFYWIRPAVREVTSADAPLDLERLVGAANPALYEQLRKLQAATVESELVESATWTSEHWTTRQYRLNVVYPSAGVGKQIDVWLADDPRVDVELLRVTRSCLQIWSPDWPWIEAVYDLQDGFPVRIVVHSPHATIRTTETELLSIEENEVPPSRFEAPADYERTPFRIEHFLQIR